MPAYPGGLSMDNGQRIWHFLLSECHFKLAGGVGVRTFILAAILAARLQCPSLHARR